jgi:soluble lytic murein transglycosylase-like protein
MFREPSRMSPSRKPPPKHCPRKRCVSLPGATRQSRHVALYGMVIAAAVWLRLEPAAAAVDVEAPAFVATPVVDNPVQFSTTPPPAEHQRLVRMVLREAGKHRLDPRLVLAVMQVESRFDSQARSPRNAQGLMQLMPDTAKRFQVEDPTDSLQNLRGGMRYLRWLLDYYQGDVVLALAAYNSGEGSVDRHKGVPPFRETVAYVQRIRALYPFDRHPFDAAKTVGTSRGPSRDWVTASVSGPIADAGRLQ